MIDNMSIVFNIRDPLTQTELDTNHRLWTFSVHSGLLPFPILYHDGSWLDLEQPSILSASNSPSEFMPVVFVWLTNYSLFISQQLGDTNKSLVSLWFIVFITFVTLTPVCMCVCVCCVVCLCHFLPSTTCCPRIDFPSSQAWQEIPSSTKATLPVWGFNFILHFSCVFSKTIFKDMQKVCVWSTLSLEGHLS